MGDMGRNARDLLFVACRIFAVLAGASIRAGPAHFSLGVPSANLVRAEIAYIDENGGGISKWKPPYDLF